VREAQKIESIQMSKISSWAKVYKIRFNKQNSKSMLLTRRKSKERKELEIYLNYTPILQVKSFKCLRIILDNKLSFRDLITAMVEKCSKLIFTLSKSAKIN